MVALSFSFSDVYMIQISLLTSSLSASFREGAKTENFKILKVNEPKNTGQDLILMIALSFPPPDVSMIHV